MEARSEELLRETAHLTSGHRTLLTLAAAVLVLGGTALALSSIHAATGGSSSFPQYENGWSVGSMVFAYVGSAIYQMSVLLGLAALVIAQSKATRRHATRMARPLFFLGVLVIAVGIGGAICKVGSDYYAHMETLRWPVAQTAFGLLGRSLVRAGTLAGLAYLSRQSSDLRTMENATSTEGLTT